MNVFVIGIDVIRDLDHIIDELRLIRDGGFGFQFSDFQNGILTNLYTSLVDTYNTITDNCVEVSK